MWAVEDLAANRRVEREIEITLLLLGPSAGWLTIGRLAL